MHNNGKATLLMKSQIFLTREKNAAIINIIGTMMTILALAPALIAASQSTAKSMRFGDTALQKSG